MDQFERAVVLTLGKYTSTRTPGLTWMLVGVQRMIKVPGGIALRTLATIEKINPDPSKTVIFALPIEFMEGVKSLGEYLKEKTK